MKDNILISLFIVLLSSITTPLFSTPLATPAPPKIESKSYILIDHYSGKVISENNAYTPMAPASLTKIMTAYVVFHELKDNKIHLDDMVTISEKAWRTAGSKMFIEVGTQVSVENLLKGLIIQSGNDAAVALSEYIAGSEDTFAALMNQHAQHLGMKNSHFSNSDGLPHKEHYTSARDMAIVSSALIRQFPEYYKWFKEPYFSYNKIKQYNRNKLLSRNKYVDGLKTGYTKEAGYCLVASAKRNTMRLISVVMGTKSVDARTQESQKLLNYGFRFYETHKLYTANKEIKRLRVFKGASQSLSVGVDKDLYLTIPTGQYQQLQPSLKITRQLIAPIKKGEKFGNITIALKGKILVDIPLVALQTIPEGSLWQKTSDSVRLWFE